MKTIAVIPARYASTRFPAKLLQDLCGKTVILRTYEAAKLSNLFDEVFVVTDSDEIFNEILSHGGKAIISSKEHESGSDRIAEAVANLEVDIVVNVQGDEPFIDKNALKLVIEAFKKDTNKLIDLVSLCRHITNKDDIENSNNVKVVLDQNNFALYFSRSVIPYPREENVGVRYLQHIGVYAFRRAALMDFYSLPMKSLEASEKLEQLRYLEYGKRIKMIETNHIGIGIDTAEDLEKARKVWKD
ncbi:MAG: 3-deoxy-manno-octulosonate cytidylyltransferase (CMP-KDO synthetase) [Flavobacterium sp.]|jgi:3-deoxy-manno-octulosonate cytidylyltransferase (CMP-KDO synthetase)